MKKHLILLGLTIVIVAALLLSACGEEETTAPQTTAPPATTPVQTTTLKLSYTMPAGGSIARGFDWFGPEFEKRTEGRYEIEIYPGSTLVSIRAALDALREGVCEIVMTSIGSFPKDFPLTGVASLPTLGFTMTNQDQYQGAYAGAWEFFDTNPEIQNEFKDFKLLFPFVLDPYNLMSKTKEIHYAADFKGLKVGSSGGKNEIISANGGAPVQQVPPQAYDNLQKGLTDVSFNTFAQVNDYHLYELCDYFYTQDFGGGFIIMLMNLDSWNKMSKKDQDIMMETWADASYESAEGSMESVAAGKNATIAAGKTITDPTQAEKDAWIVASEPAFKKWRDDAIALGATTSTLDKVMNSWKDILKKYQK